MVEAAGPLDPSVADAPIVRVTDTALEVAAPSAAGSISVSLRESEHWRGLHARLASSHRRWRVASYCDCDGMSRSRHTEVTIPWSSLSTIPLRP